MFDDKKVDEALETSTFPVIRIVLTLIAIVVCVMVSQELKNMDSDLLFMIGWLMFIVAVFYGAFEIVRTIIKYVGRNQGA